MRISDRVKLITFHKLSNQRLPLTCMGLFLAASSFAVNTAHAANLQHIPEAELHNPTLSVSRDAYKALKRKIRNTSGRGLISLEKEVEQFRDYPLFPYLYYELVRKNLSYSNRKQIEHFLDEMQGIPIRDVLLKKWLNYLAKNNYKTVFLNTYEAGLGTALLCKNLHIERVKRGANNAWYQQVEVIWLSGYSLPDSCDPVLKYWRQNGKLTPQLAIERMALAGATGQRSLSRYLKSYAPKNAHYIADMWSKVRSNPANALQPKRFPFVYPTYDEKIVKWGLNRMSWRSPERVIDSIQTWQNSGKLSESTLQSVKETLAISLALDNHPKAQEWLMRAASAKSSHGLWRWYLMHAVRNENWSRIVDIARTSPPAQRSSSEFKYWLARALEQLDRQNLAQKIYADLSIERHYYGFMAATQLGQTLQFLPQPAQINESAINTILKRPAILRARELFATGEYVSARREWFRVVKTFNDVEKNAAMHLAHHWEWHDQAIVAALKTGAQNDLEIRFPLAHLSSFEDRSQRYSIDTSYAMAIARRESSFMTDAVSSADARGLMQVLPNTAKYLLKTNKSLPSSFKRKVSTRRIKYDLFNPDINIEFGLSYLQFLSDKFQGNPVLITAAYNAGWQKVKDWLPESHPQPADIWIDTIPFKETREYVKAIFAYQAIYDRHRKLTPEGFNKLVAMQVPARQN